MLTIDEMTAHHEAAHAVVALESDWLLIVQDVVVGTYGGGHSGMMMNQPALLAAIEADPNFDPDIPRREMLRMLFAGSVAEILLVEQGFSDFSNERIARGFREDREIAEQTLGKMAYPASDEFQRIEGEVKAFLMQPKTWCAVRLLAEELQARRRMTPSEMKAAMVGINERCAKETEEGQAEL